MEENTALIPRPVQDGILQAIKRFSVNSLQEEVALAVIAAREALEFIVTAETAEAGSQLRKTISESLKKHEAARVRDKRPALDLGKIIDETYEPLLNKLRGGYMMINEKLTTFAAADKKRKQEAALAAIKKSEEERQLLEELAAEANKEGDAKTADEFMAQAEEIPTIVEPPPAKINGFAAVDHFVAEVTDIKALCRAVADEIIPGDAIEPNQSWLNKAVRTGRNIPGVKKVNKPYGRAV